MDKDKASQKKLKTAGAVVGGAVFGAAFLPVGKNTKFSVEKYISLLVETENCLVLPLLGFSSAGVVAGTIAASAQSYVYGAFTTGVFRFFVLIMNLSKTKFEVLRNRPELQESVVQSLVLWQLQVASPVVCWLISRKLRPRRIRLRVAFSASSNDNTDARKKIIELIAISRKI